MDLIYSFIEGHTSSEPYDITLLLGDIWKWSVSNAPPFEVKKGHGENQPPQQCLVIWRETERKKNRLLVIEYDITYLGGIFFSLVFHVWYLEETAAFQVINTNLTCWFHNVLIPGRKGSVRMSRVTRTALNCLITHAERPTARSFYQLEWA